MCCSKARCLKGLIFTTNVMFVVVGMAMLVAVSKAVTDVHLFREFVDIDPALRAVYNGMYILIASGLLLFATGGFGVVAAIRENRYMLYLYATIILVLMGMKIVGFIVIFGNYPSEKAFLLSTMDIYHNDELMTPCDEIMDADKQKICYYELRIKQQETNWVALMKDTHWKRDHNTSDLIKQIGGPIVSAKWDILQQSNECCGINGAEDWLASDFDRIPPECCFELNRYWRMEISSQNKDVNRTYCKKEVAATHVGCETKAQAHAQWTGIFFFIAFISEICMIGFTCAFVKETLSKETV